MEIFTIGQRVLALVDGGWYECDIRGLPKSGEKAYELNCQGETIRRDAEELRSIG